MLSSLKGLDTGPAKSLQYGREKFKKTVSRDSILAQHELPPHSSTVFAKLFLAWSKPSSRLALIALASLPLTLPLLLFGLPNGHDAPAHCLWGQSIAFGWAAGIPDPRWIDLAAEGDGNPALLFYPPASAWLSGALMLLGASPSWALGLLAVTALIAGSYASSRLFEDPRVSLSLAWLSLYSPYLSYCIFIRAALAEALALACVPCLLKALRDALEGQPEAERGVLLWSLALLLIHPLTAVLWAPCFCLWLLLWSPSPKALGRPFLAIAAALLLASFWLLPWLCERSTVQYSRLLEKPGALEQVLQWPHAGADALARRRLRIGALGVLTLLAPLALQLRWPVFKQRALIAALGLSACVYFFLCGPWGRGAYELLPWLKMAQYPWRHLGPALWLTAAVTALMATQQRAFPVLGPVIFVAWLLLCLSFAGKGHWQQGQEMRVEARSIAVAPEYTPRQAEPWPGGERPVMFKAGSAEGPWYVDAAEWRPGRRRLVLRAEWSGSFQLLLRTRGHRGWSLWRDGQRQPVDFGQRPWLGADLVLKEGQRTELVWRYDGPASRRWGLYLSLLTALGLGLGWKFKS